MLALGKLMCHKCGMSNTKSAVTVASTASRVKITMDQILEAVERGMTSTDNPGFCTACGAEQEGCEPDMRNGFAQFTINYNIERQYDSEHTNTKRRNAGERA